MNSSLCLTWPVRLYKSLLPSSGGIVMCSSALGSSCPANINFRMLMRNVYGWSNFIDFFAIDFNKSEFPRNLVEIWP